MNGSVKKVVIAFLFLIYSKNILSQQVKICVDSIHSSFRGLSVVNDNLLWVSGSNGTVGRSTDGGKTWNWITVKGFEKADFRDVEAFDENTAIIMAVDAPAYILRTTDGGQNWKRVYSNKAAGMFLDAMDFWDHQNGIVVGDPLNGRFFMAETSNGGKTWHAVPEEKRPVADSGEACFAASGTNVKMLGSSKAVFVSGGLSSHIFMRNKKVALPFLQGKETTGANSIAVKNDKTLIVVGGDFLRKNETNGNCAISNDGGKTWIQPTSAPTGYRSCVEYLLNNNWITCGLNGVDISEDDGMNWKNISGESFNVCRKAKKGTSVYFAGSSGIVAKLQQQTNK